MKKLFTGIILVVSGLGCIHAQFNTDSKMVGASSYMDLGLIAQKNKETDTKTKNMVFDINPRFGYFIDNMFAAGMDLDISMSRRKVGDLDPTSSNYYATGFFTRYYYQTASPVVPFGEFNAGLGRSVSKYVSAGESFKTKQNILYAGAGAGAAFFLADNFALERLLIYTFRRQNNPETDVVNVTHSLMLECGFTFFFDSMLQQ